MITHEWNEYLRTHIPPHICTFHPSKGHSSSWNTLHRWSFVNVSRGCANALDCQTHYRQRETTLKKGPFSNLYQSEDYQGSPETRWRGSDQRSSEVWVAGAIDPLQATARDTATYIRACPWQQIRAGIHAAHKTNPKRADCAIKNLPSNVSEDSAKDNRKCILNYKHEKLFRSNRYFIFTRYHPVPGSLEIFLSKTPSPWHQVFSINSHYIRL